jgi:hypothetical protein
MKAHEFALEDRAKSGSFATNFIVLATSDRTDMSHTKVSINDDHK